jgi:heme a synthase
MSRPSRRIPTLRALAIACAVLVLAITTLSAFIRLSRAGLGCQPWPQCYGQQASGAEERALPAVTPAVAAARVAHRITAVAALLLIIGMVMSTLAGVPMRWREGRLALALLGLALFLAILGRLGADSRLPAVVLGNLLAGLAMFAVSCRLVAASAGRSLQSGVSRGWLATALLLVLAQIALGGLVSAAQAGLSCPQLLACDPAPGSWQALNPWREPASDPGTAGALLHFLHRAGSLLLAAVLVPLGILAWRRARATAALLLVLLAAQVLSGASLVLLGLPLAAALVHNVLAALLLATLLRLWPERAAQEKVSGSPSVSSAR